MKLRYQAPKRQRIKRFGFFSITNFERYWWSKKENKWTDAAYGGCSSHYYGCRSVKAFRRILRKWSKYLPPGIEFILVSRWVGHDVYGKTG